MELQKNINIILRELSNFSIDKKRDRFLKNHLDNLYKYQRSHPDKLETPNSLELFCDDNPDAPECRIYEL